MNTYTIKEISTLFQLPASTLRYYEDMEILPDVEHTASGQRIYTENHVGRLKAICCFKRAGVTISDIRKYFLLEDNKFTYIDEILVLLKKNKAGMEAKLKQLNADLVHINEKLAYYGAIKEAIKKSVLRTPSRAKVLKAQLFLPRA